MNQLLVRLMARRAAATAGVMRVLLAQASCRLRCSSLLSSAHAPARQRAAQRHPRHTMAILHAALQSARARLGPVRELLLWTLALLSVLFACLLAVR